MSASVPTVLCPQCAEWPWFETQWEENAKGLRPGRHLFRPDAFRLLYQRGLLNWVVPPPPPSLSIDPTPHACDEDQETWPRLSLLGRSHSRPPNQILLLQNQPADGGSRAACSACESQTLFPSFFVRLCYDCSLDLWKALDPHITVRDSTDAVIWLMFFMNWSCVPQGVCLWWMCGLLSNVHNTHVTQNIRNGASRWKKSRTVPL